MTPDFIAHFWGRVDKTETCWLWTAGKISAGYGETWDGKRVLRAHRVSYELTFGPIPKGLCVLHRCDVRACVRPSHLFLGTRTDNNRDMVAKGRAGFITRPERVPRGETHGMARHSDTVVAEVRRRYAAGASTRSLATEYGAHITTIQKWMSGSLRAA